MNRGEFLHALRQRLSVLPEEDVDRTVFYYSEILDDMIEDGKSEEEAVAELESVDEIAQRIISESSDRVIPQPSYRSVTSQKKSKAGIVLLILLIVLFPAWLGLFIAAWSISFSFFAASTVCILTGIVGIPISIIRMMNEGVLGLFGLGLSLFSLGFGIMFFIGTIYYTKALGKFICFICRKIKSAF